MKLCNKCNLFKSEFHFSNDKRSNDGKCSQCKQCQREYKQSKRDSIILYMKKYYLRPEVKQRLAETRECRAQRTRKWRKNPSNKARESQIKKERRKRPDVKQKEQKYRKKTKGIRSSQWHKYISMKHGAPGNFSINQWNEMCKIANYRCVACGTEGKLTIDHIVPLTLGGCNCIHNIQPLCVSCNSSKGNRNSIDYRTQEITEWIKDIPHNHLLAHP